MGRKDVLSTDVMVGEKGNDDLRCLHDFLSLHFPIAV